MTLKPRTLVIAVLGAVIVVSLLFVAFREDPVPVDLHEVQTAPMEVTINADGKTRISEVYEVSAPVTGTARRSPVRVGDVVKSGETVVAVVEPARPQFLDTRAREQAEAAVREAEAALNVAQSEMSQAEENLVHARNHQERMRLLVERGVVSLTRLEDADQQLALRRAEVEGARFNLARAGSALERARAALIEPEVGVDSTDDACCIRLTAPVDGRVLSIDQISERPVNTGARLLSIGQPQDLEIVADLLSTDAVKLDIGAPARVERWGGSPELEAELKKIEPSAYTKISALGIEEQRVDVVFDLITPVEERGRLGDGFAVFLRIVEWQSDGVLQVPLSALFRDGEGWAVFTVENDLAKLQPVAIGRRNDEYAEVLDGLQSGQVVIEHPSDAIADGVPVVSRSSG